jgi:NADP-dependent 3-hydroxy acid dehydrogenase YdfG
MQPSKLIILSASSDIGEFLTKHYLSQSVEVIGTFKTESQRIKSLADSGAILFPVDISVPEQVNNFITKLIKLNFEWDTLISAPGLLEPIGPFFGLDYEKWEQSVLVNSLSQLRVLHGLYPLRNKKTQSKVLFFAGGGTNGPFDNYSAYCLGKLALLKMTELLDSEYVDLKTSIIGTGWVNTKIHQQTLDAGVMAGVNFQRTKHFMEKASANSATLSDVLECINWCLGSPKEAVGGRNFSLVHDDWRNPAFIKKLIANPEIHKLRRFS